jgi:hypothetical protein
MTRAVLPLALIFAGAGPALAAESFMVEPGQWDGRHVTVSGGQETSIPVSRCIPLEEGPLTAASFATMIDPAGTCEILDAAFERDLSLIEVRCTGGAVSRGSLLVIPGTDEFAIYADVEFSAAGASHGAIKVESRRSGACTAP